MHPAIFVMGEIKGADLNKYHPSVLKAMIESLFWIGHLRNDHILSHKLLTNYKVSNVLTLWGNP